MWRHVFLDFGGTLAQEKLGRHEIYAEEAARAGLCVAPERMRAEMARAHAELPARIGAAWRYDDAWFRAYMERIFCRELGLAAGALPPLARALFARFADPATFRLAPGALELLEALRRADLRVGIVSNWSTALPKLVDGLGLGALVDVVVTSALEGVEKPDPEIFARALARIGGRAETGVHAGDSYERDVLGARTAGLDAVLVGRPDALPPGESGGSLLVAGSLRELRELILERVA
jgi:putative hydrolase of the HAD superfamily